LNLYHQIMAELSMQQESIRWNRLGEKLQNYKFNLVIMALNGCNSNERLSFTRLRYVYVFMSVVFWVFWPKIWGQKFIRKGVLYNRPRCWKFKVNKTSGTVIHFFLFFQSLHFVDENLSEDLLRPVFWATSSELHVRNYKG
jgi:hypothetical protein